MTNQLPLFADVQPIAKPAKARKAKPAQMEMFAQSELAQFGVVANPRMDLSSGRLGMIIEDTRTAEEKERDAQHEAEALNGKLF